MCLCLVILVLGVLEELRGVEELAVVKKMALFEVYASLRLLGFRRLAYVFERPPRRPWNKTSREIYQQCGTINYYITIPSWLLDQRVVKAELKKFVEWIESTSSQSEEFRSLVRKVLDTWARAILLKYPEDLKDPEGRWREDALEGVMPRGPLEWKEEYEERYENLRIVATALAKAQELSDKYGYYLYVTLMGD